MRELLPYWPQLVLFAAVVLLLALYGLAVSGHFPAEFRGAAVKQGAGPAVLWGSMLLAALAATAALIQAWKHLPWHAAIISGGAALLFAPLLLRPFPDSFVNGLSGLLVFSLGAAVLAALSRMAF
jgi:hypothetical protein